MIQPEEKEKPDVDFEAAHMTWAADRSPQANATMLKTLDPVINSAIRTHVRTSNPLIKARARKITLSALGSYNPKRGRLKAHLYSQLQGLKRQYAQQAHIMRVPERILLDRRGLKLASTELEDELGREPTDQELATRTGLSTKRISKVRQYSPAMSEGFLAGIGEAGGHAPAVKQDISNRAVWLQVIYDELGPFDKKIMEWTMGINGHPILSNEQIAMRLKRSPGAISQRKAMIQKMLDEEQEISPFV